MDLSWLFLMNVAIGVLIIVLGIPMMQEKIKPNRIYGFRTKKTLSDEKIWYAANKDAGKLMVKTGAIIGLVSLLIYFFGSCVVSKMSEGGVTLLWLIVFGVPIIYLIAASFAALKKY